MFSASPHQEFQFLRTLPIHCFVQLLMAVLCGAIVGLERELKRKAAGIRTNAMICLGSALYMILSEILISQHATPSADTTRIAGQVVVGLGFIGAGTIIQSRGRVVGLTSAATLWVVAAIGLIIGAGYPLFGLMVTLFVVALLTGVGKLEFVLMGKCKSVTTHVSFRDDPKTWGAIRELFETHSKKIEEATLKRESGICFLEIEYCNVHPDHKEFLIDLLNIHDVRHASFNSSSQ